MLLTFSVGSALVPAAFSHHWSWVKTAMLWCIQHHYVGICDWKSSWTEQGFGGASMTLSESWPCKMGYDKCMGCWREGCWLQHISLSAVVTALFFYVSLSRTGNLCCQTVKHVLIISQRWVYRNRLCNWFQLKTSPDSSNLPLDENQKEKKELFETDLLSFFHLPHHLTIFFYYTHLF